MLLRQYRQQRRLDDDHGRGTGLSVHHRHLAQAAPGLHRYHGLVDAFLDFNMRIFKLKPVP
jgi:hypothetical protein